MNSPGARDVAGVRRISGAWGADRVQHFADRHGGSDYASVVITRVLLDLDAFFLEHRCCGELDGGETDERAWLACLVWGARIERLVEAS
jgi:hypothetical protein